MKATIISSAVLVALAAAAPTSKSVARTAKSLPGVFYIDGDRVDVGKPNAIAVKSPCTVDDDVFTCAEKTAAAWKVPGGYSSSSVPMNIGSIITWGGQELAADISFNYSTGLSSCKLSDPQYTDHQPLFDCNDNGGCKQTFTFQSTTTSMDSEGWHVGASLQAGFNIGIASASVTVTGDWMQSWANTTSYTNTVSREYDLNAGDVCAPTTIQFEIECRQQMFVDSPFGAADVLVYFQDGTTTTVQLPICTNGGKVANPLVPSATKLVANSADQALYQAVCQAINTPTGLAVDVNNFDGKTAWSIQGCMAW